MYDPQGTLRDVPFSMLKDAVANGGVPAHPVQTPEIDPSTGKPIVRMVPVTRLKEAVENGGTIQPLNSDEGHLPTAYGFSLGNLASNAWEGAKSVVKGAAAVAGDLASNPNWVEGPDSTLSKFVFKPADAEADKAKDLWNQGRYSEAIGHGLAAATPLVGPAAAQLGEQAGSGDIGGAVAKGAGMVAGGAALNLGAKVVKAGTGAVIDAVKESPKAAGTIPVRLAARGAEAAINQKLVPLRPLASIMTPADAAEATQFKVPGRDYGLPPKAAAPEAELDATGENRIPFAGGMDEPAPQKVLDATGENKVPFAGGMDEPPAPKKPAQSAAAPEPVASTPAAQTAPNATADPVLERLRAIAAKNEAEEAAAKSAAPAEDEDLTAPMQKMLDEIIKKKAAGVKPVLNRLFAGEAGQAGAPGAVTDADEGIADIQNRPVSATLTREVPARGFLQKVGADENSVLKTQGDLDSVFYHRQQIAQNGMPNVELHVDDGGNVIGAQGRHRAIAAIQQGGPGAKVNVTIFKHPVQNPE